MGNCGTKSTNYAEEEGHDVPGGEQSNISTADALHGGAILGLTCLRNGTLCTCSDDKSLVIYDWKENTRMQLTGHAKAVNKVVGSRRDSKFIFSTSRDLSVKQWRQDSGECIQTLPDAHTLNIPGLALSPDECKLCTGSRDYSVKIWDIETAKVNATYSSPRNIVTTIVWGSDTNGDQNIVYQGSEDLCIRGWDTRQSSKVPAIHLTGFVYFPTSLTVSNDGNLLAAGCKGFDKNGCDVKIWDLRVGNGKSPNLLHELGGHEHDVTGVRFMKNNAAEIPEDYLVSVSRDGYMRRWDGLWNEVTSKRFLLSDRSSFSCVDSWQNVSDSFECCAMGDIKGTVYIVGSDGDVLHTTAAGVTMD